MPDPKPPLPFVIESRSGRYIVFSDKDLITQQLMEQGAWEEHTFQILCALMQQNQGDMLDIGANMGAIAIPVARVFPDRRVFCFEAQRQVYQQLCGNAVLNMANNIYPYHMAIGNPAQAGEVIQVPVPDYFRDANIGSVTLDQRVNNANGWTYPAHESVALMRVDDLGLGNIGVVKIDVEGMELDVIRGMQDTLARSEFPPVLFEVWKENRYEWTGPERVAILSLLEEMGYVVDIFENVTTGLAQHKSRTSVKIQIQTKPR